MKNLCAKLLVLLILGVSGLASASDVDQSWKKASVYTPGAFLSKSTDGLALDKKYPVVIYMHGCTGITNHNDLAWAKYIAEMNFVVVVPDSMARKSRLSNCDPRQKGNTATYGYVHMNITGIMCIPVLCELASGLPSNLLASKSCRTIKLYIS